MPKFLVDEDLPRSLAVELRRRGLDAADVRDVGLRGAPDKKIWQRAIDQGWTLVSGDQGFANTLTFPLGTHFGILVGRFRNETPSNEVTEALAAAIESLSDEEIRGNLITVEPGRIRLRRAYLVPRA